MARKCSVNVQVLGKSAGGRGLDNYLLPAISSLEGTDEVRQKLGWNTEQRSENYIDNLPIKKLLIVFINKKST